MVVNERSIHRYLIFFIILALISGLFVGLIDADSIQFSSISLELLKHNDWLHIQHQRTNYIELPPLLFWLSAFSFKVFGLSNLGYKLFGFIFMLISIYSTFKLTKIYYGQRAGRMAAIILGTNQGFFALLLDFRTDTILLGSVIFAIWQLTKYLRSHQFKNLLLGFLGISLAMLAQGLIGLLLPMFAIGIDLVLRQKWEDIFKWQWLIGIPLIGIFLAPMILGLNDQLLSLGKTNVSAIYFFFTEQNFTRTSTDRSAIFIYFWAFLPWIVFTTLALIDKLYSSFILNDNKKSKKHPEHISVGGFLFTLVFIAISGHHLPHSIYILTPFGAIFTAAYMDKMKPQSQNILYKIQTFLIFGLWMLSFLLLFYIFTPVNIVVAIISVLFFAMTVWSLFKLPPKKAIFVGTAIWAISFAFIQSNHTYPKLLSYQSDSQIEKWSNTHPKELMRITDFGMLSEAKEFYSGQTIDKKSHVSQLTKQDRFLYTDDIGVQKIKQANIPYLIMKEHDGYNGSNLTLTFLNPKTRQNVLQKRYLIAIYPK